MMKTSKINVKTIENSTELGNSRFEFKISGPNINYIVVNTLRRTILSDIPVYAFDEFKFDKNTSIFHNNYLKLRLRHMPVWGIENDVEFIDLEIPSQPNDLKEENEVEEISNENSNDNIELNIDKNLNASTLKQLTMYVNAKNKTNNITTVTTADAKFYYGEKQIVSPYKVDIPIVKLQPTQEITFSAITKIGSEISDVMFSPVSIVGYKQIKDDEFDFYLESRGQINERRILYVGLLNIERRLGNFIKLIENDKTDTGEKNNQGIIIVNGEDHTLGNLISRGLQSHPKISFAGYNLPHPLAKKVNFHYKLKNKDNIKEIIKQVVDYYLDVFSQIKKLFE